MRKAIIVIAFLFATIGVMAQGPFEGFFKPKAGTETYFTKETSREWYFRPAAQLTALQFTYNKDLKQFESSTFSSAGIGIGYQHYVDNAGELVNNFGFNALIVFDASQSSNASIGFALTANALQFVNLGLGLNFRDLKANDRFPVFILTGCVWTF